MKDRPPTASTAASAWLLRAAGALGLGLVLEAADEVSGVAQRTPEVDQPTIHVPLLDIPGSSSPFCPQSLDISDTRELAGSSA